VFATADQFDRYYEQMRRHAKKYKVSAMTFARLSADFPGFAKDFSIIEAQGSKILAEYDGTAPLRNINFVADADEIADHEREFREIARLAVPVKGADSEQDTLRDLLFPSGLTGYEKRPIEMSAYISVIDYDAFEEGHVHYKEMMACMVEEMGPTTNRRVLEVGAGTGILTRRLAVLSGITVVALEIDWACYLRLAQNLRQYPNVRCENKDSRVYDPEGEFDFIFSSFADHHIKPADKARYFKNIRRNLKPGGKFIVGDEFLRPHDRNNSKEWEGALRAYHGYVMDVAKKDGKMELVGLEDAALTSGLTRRGDFKVTVAEYEEHLRAAGFRFEKHLIGPANANEVGGIFVYVATLT
jgi:ubiquinone/menaquinone biosynthesis C-methylase UbiE